MAVMILLPYDQGCPHLLWRDGESAVISALAASVLRMHGFGLSSEYLMVDGKPSNPQLTYPSNLALDLEGARQAADWGVFKISKKARRLLE